MTQNKSPRNDNFSKSGRQQGIHMLYTDFLFETLYDLYSEINKS